MSIKDKFTIFFWFVIALFIFFHSIYLNTPLVNYEYTIFEAVKSLLNPNYTKGMDIYWSKQANPLGYSLVAATSAYFFGISYWSIRLPSMLGGVFILLAGFIYFHIKYYEKKILLIIWVLMVSLNPLFWVYSGRAFSDVLAVAFLSWAFLFCYLSNDSYKLHFLGGLCFSFAILVKFNSVLLGLGFFSILFVDKNIRITLNKKKILSALFYTILPVLILSVYFYLIYYNFGILFISETAQNHFDEKAKYFVDCFLMYTSYLTMLLGFASLIPIYYLSRIWSRKRFITCLIISLVLGIFFWKNITFFSLGEMGYGRLFESFLNIKALFLVRTGCLILSFFVFFEWMHRMSYLKNKTALFIISIILPYLLIASLSKPVQRYLLFCLPFLTFYLIIIVGAHIPKRIHFFTWPTIGIFAILSLVSVAYQIGVGQASENIAKWLEKNNYLKDTDVGSLDPDATHYFLGNSTMQKKYNVIISKTPPEDYLYKESVKVFGRTIRTHYVIKL